MSPFYFEFLSQKVTAKILEVNGIVICAKPVSKYPVAFVEPKFSKSIWVVDRGWIAHKNSLENLRNISQIESVVELGRNRK
jgi:hypothetical protein